MNIVSDIMFAKLFDEITALGKTVKKEDTTFAVRVSDEARADWSNKTKTISVTADWIKEDD